MKGFIPIVLALALAGTAVRADGPLATLVGPAESARMEGVAALRGEWAALLRQSDPGSETLPLLEAGGLSLRDGFDATGTWRCRTHRQAARPGDGGPGPWGRCVISDDGAGWHLEGPLGTGSTAGYFYDHGARQTLYLGVRQQAGEPAPGPRYGELPERDQLGRVAALADGRLRVSFPELEPGLPLAVLELQRLEQTGADTTGARQPAPTAAPPPAPTAGATEPPPDLGGAWRLSPAGQPGVPGCLLVLEQLNAGDAGAISMAPDCGQHLTFMAGAVRWSLPQPGRLLLLDASAAPVLELERLDPASWQGERAEGGGRYTLQRLQ